jgi:hypothetical protein
VEPGAVMDNNGYVGADVDGGADGSVGAVHDRLVSHVDDFSRGPSEIAENDCSALDEEHRYLDRETTKSDFHFSCAIQKSTNFPKLYIRDLIITFITSIEWKALNNIGSGYLDGRVFFGNYLRKYNT